MIAISIVKSGVFLVNSEFLVVAPKFPKLLPEAETPFVLEGKVWPSVIHFVEAYALIGHLPANLHEATLDAVRGLPAAEVFSLHETRIRERGIGRQLPRDEQVVRLRATAAKFQYHPNLALELLNTGDVDLIREVHWPRPPRGLALFSLAKKVYQGSVTPEAIGVQLGFSEIPADLLELLEVFRTMFRKYEPISKLQGDGTMGPEFRLMQAVKQSRHLLAKATNIEILTKSGIPFELKNNDEMCIFRVEHKPKTDFWPSTGRWRMVVGGRTYSGGAKSFLAWYAKQSMAH